MHVACRMVGRKVEHGEHMLVVIDLRSLEEREAHALEDVDDLVSDKRQRMTRSQADGVGCACQVEALRACLGGLHLLTQSVDLLCGGRFQLIDLDAKFTLLLLGHIAEVGNDGVDFTFLAQVFQSELLYVLCVFGRERGHFFEKLVYLVC